MTSDLDPTPDAAGRHDDFGGLGRDLPRLIDRRRALRWVGGVGLGGLLAACSTDPGRDDGATTTLDGATTSTPSATDAAGGSGAGTNEGSGAVGGDGPLADAPVLESSPGAEIPDETAGPFPADGTNGPNVLDIDGVVRSDLRPSIGGLTGVAEGVATTLHLTVVDAATGEPIPGAAIYLWHCTADGQYSVYEIEDQNYLRGVQVADDAGRLAFTTVFPGCYRGRWPHCHLEVYPTLDDAATGATAIKTSQLALPRADCEVVFADGRYGESQRWLAELTLAEDGAFSDGWEDQLAMVAGSVDDGYVVSLLVRV